MKDEEDRCHGKAIASDISEDSLNDMDSELCEFHGWVVRDLPELDYCSISSFREEHCHSYNNFTDPYQCFWYQAKQSYDSRLHVWYNSFGLYFSTEQEVYDTRSQATERLHDPMEDIVNQRLHAAQ